MKTNVDIYQFRQAFETIRPDNFSYHGLAALLNHIEDIEDDAGEEIELDVIALCCEFSEYPNIFEAMNDHGAHDAIGFKEDHLVATFDGGVIIRS